MNVLSSIGAATADHASRGVSTPGCENGYTLILRKPAAEHPDEYWDEVIETNLNAQFVISREIGKRMVAPGAGKIIFTASLLTKALANEWAPKVCK